jgi:hypothetical protein
VAGSALIKQLHQLFLRWFSEEKRDKKELSAEICRNRAIKTKNTLQICPTKSYFA